MCRRWVETECEDLDYVDEVTGEFIKGFRKYGVSKEHRPNPLVQMGLFMDRNGLPLTLCLNSGSDGETLCALPLEKGTLFSSTPILDTLKNMDVVNVQNLYYMAAYTGSEVLTALNGLYDLKLDRKYYRPKEINSKI